MDIYLHSEELLEKNTDYWATHVTIDNTLDKALQDQVILTGFGFRA